MEWISKHGLMFFRAGWFQYESMTHHEYLLMRTARLTMMKTMLIGIPGVRPHSYPGLWYTFDNMGHLLDSLTTGPRPLVGQMAAINEFFHNPQRLLINPEPHRVIFLER